jgi:hypothetical protein
MIGLVGSFASAKTKEVQLRNGATKAGDGFYLRITAQVQRPAIASIIGWAPNTTMWMFRVPHKVGEDTVGDSDLQIEDRAGDALVYLHLTPSAISGDRHEDELSIVAVPELAEKMHLIIQYFHPLPGGGGQFIMRRYHLQLRDYMSLVK